MTKQEEKQQLRKIMRKLEQQLPPRYRQAADRSIAAHLLAMPEYQAAGAVFCFVGTPTEIDTRPILTDALARGKTLCVPACVDRTTMVLRRIFRLEELSPGAYGILEPPADAPCIAADSVDFTILPCLTCSHTGHRLGRGLGYYDRFLSNYRGGTVLLCREKLIREEIPVEGHDYPVPWVLTERGLYEDGTPARLG
jgi:5-formyltetrahydrofolate cyclo-ligase